MYKPYAKTQTYLLQGYTNEHIYILVIRMLEILICPINFSLSLRQITEVQDLQATPTMASPVSCSSYNS